MFIFLISHQSNLPYVQKDSRQELLIEVFSADKTRCVRSDGLFGTERGLFINLHINCTPLICCRAHYTNGWRINKIMATNAIGLATFGVPF